VRVVFADTFYWVALTNPDDSRYQDAIAFDNILADATILTTDEILTEFMTFFSADPWQRSRAAATVRSLLTDPEVRVIPQSRESFLAGMNLYEARPDKGYSLTDCISMQTTKDFGKQNMCTWNLEQRLQSNYPSQNMCV
jgi:predicted nucleic acid-binding protein